MTANHRDPSSLPAPDPLALAHSDALHERIGQAIAAAGGWLGFNRYMELALYTPGLGYYSGGAVKFGRRAEDGSDFVTAPELSPLFARALANAVGDALVASGTREVMEFGAGSGKLAAGVLAALDARNTPCTRYTIIELSGVLRARQRETLHARAPQLLDRVVWLERLPESFSGVIVGNEVLDAMPVRIFARRAGQWLERGVACDVAGALTFEERAPVEADLPRAALNRIDALIDLDEDYLTETHQAAEGFISTVCEMLLHGAALFVDYGFTEREYYHPQRGEGTVMCHYRHRAHSDPFLYPGLQDITAHVNFSALAERAEQSGATLLGYTSQARFLMNCGIIELLAELDARDAATFLPASNAVQKLLSEAEMGELFKVIAFGRGFKGGFKGEPLGFAHGDRSHTL